MNSPVFPPVMSFSTKIQLNKLTLILCLIVVGITSDNGISDSWVKETNRMNTRTCTRIRIIAVRPSHKRKTPIPGLEPGSHG